LISPDLKYLRSAIRGIAIADNGAWNVQRDSGIHSGRLKLRLDFLPSSLILQ